jgi:hypothetical protein
MATVRPTPTSYYYSGQGRLGLGDFDSTTGEFKNVVFVGNVTSLTLDIEVTKFEHKESMTGDRSIDLTIIQEKNATFNFTSESLILSLVAAGLYGNTGTQAGAAVTNELHYAKRGFAIPLKHPDVSSLSAETVVGSTPLVEGEDSGDDYTVDYEFGTMYISSTSTVIISATAEQQISVDYTYAAYDYIEAFTTGTPPEKYLRFEGLNTVTGDLRLIEIYRGALEPLTGMEFINEELGSGEFSGNALPNLTIVDPTKSKYFRERRITT